MKVVICVFQGVEELDFVGFLEPLAITNRILKSRYFEYSLAGIENDSVICSGGMKVEPDAVLDELKSSDCDLLFVPGGGASTNGGVTKLLQDERTLSKIKGFYDEGKLVWSVCTGALVLGKAGLLKKKSATTHHGYLTRLESYGANALARRIVRSGRITTAGGISSSIDLGLELVRSELGKKFAMEVCERMEYLPHQ